jgi:N-acyl-D-aspartate/D-glutamate deacylase
MPEFDVIIRGGTVVDGLLTPRYNSDIAIKNGKVAQIGGLRTSSAEKVLDASGLIVAPGFVDLHTHYDAQIQWDPYCTISGWHGVTTVAIGNCGFGFAPCRPVEEDRDRAMLCLTRNEAIPFDAMKKGMSWDWVNFAEFLDRMDNRVGKGVNLISYQPLTPIYSWVMGWDGAKKRRPTETELEEMCRLLEEGMAAGACGWSAQVSGENSGQRDYDGTPMITDLMTDEEILAFGRVLAKLDRGFIQITYAKRGDDGSRYDEHQLWLNEKLAEVSGRPILYQIVEPDDRDPDLHRKKLQWLEECNNRGLRLYGQGLTGRGTFNFTFEDWNLFDGSPGWRAVTTGTLEEKKAKMQNSELRQLLRQEWDNGMRPSPQMDGDIEGMEVAEVGSKEFERYVGMTVGEIARQENKHVIDACLDLTVADDLKTEFFGKKAHENPEIIGEVVNSRYCIPGLSDGGAHVKFTTIGNFPTDTLTWLVRDSGAVSLEEAHNKLSYLPAFFGGIQDRGFIREGAPADLVVYDLENLKSTEPEVVHDLPGGDWRRVQKAEGYRWIFVNGQVTFEDGKETGDLPGRILRHGRA